MKCVSHMFATAWVFTNTIQMLNLNPVFIPKCLEGNPAVPNIMVLNVPKDWFPFII